MMHKLFMAARLAAAEWGLCKLFPAQGIHSTDSTGWGGGGGIQYMAFDDKVIQQHGHNCSFLLIEGAN